MVSEFEAKLAGIASEEFRVFGGHHEADPVMSARIQTYWASLGLKFPGVETPWSAVFVSWCMQQAGATSAEFKFSAAHSVFVKAAIDNAEARRGTFRAMKFDLVSPAIGDLIHWNQPGNRFDFAHAATHSNYASHSAVTIALGQDTIGRFATTIGGNEANSVGRTRVPLNAAGFVVQRSSMPFISIVQTLK